MASAEKRGSGPTPWRARYTKPDGSYGSKSGFATKRKAEAWGNDQEAKIREGTWIDPDAGKMKFRDWAEQWLAAQGVQDSTLDSYRQRIKNHILPEWGDKGLAEFTPIRVQAWHNDLKSRQKLGYANGIRDLLATMLDDAVRERLISWHGARAVTGRRRGAYVAPPAEEEKVWATVPQILAIVANIAKRWQHPDYGLLVLLMAFTGMRWSEATGLKREFVWLDSQEVRVEVQLLRRDDGTYEEKDPKYDSKRTLRIPKFLADLLDEHLRRMPAGRDHLFLTPDGNHLHRGAFGEILAAAVEGRKAWHDRPAIPAVGPAGLTNHGLRHSQKVMLDHLKTPAKAAKMRMGHKRDTRSGVETYDHVSDEMVQDIVDGLQAMYEAALES